MEEGKKRSRVGGKMEEEKDRRNSRRRFQAGEPRAGEHSCGLPRALWLPFSGAPHHPPMLCTRVPESPTGGQPKLQRCGQARPAKPGERQVMRVSRAPIPAGKEPPRQSGAAEINTEERG